MTVSNSFKIFLVGLMFSTISANCQNFNEKWGIGLNVSSVLYSEKDGPKVGGRLIATVPGISVSRYLGDRFTLSATFSNSIRDSQQYLSSDFALSYDIFNPDRSLRPYILGGLGVVNLLDSGLTINVGSGATLWVSKSIGLNGQLQYKMSTFGGEFQRSHFFSSMGIIYSFQPSRSKRIWER